jgi:AraC-like DNA-binding protein
MADAANGLSRTSRNGHRSTDDGNGRAYGHAAATNEPGGEIVSRRCLLDLSVGFVEDLRRANVRPGRSPEDFCGDFQVCLPYRGLFVWHVGGDEVVGDPNQVVFVRAGEAYSVSGPICEGYAELIITPAIEVLDELAHAGGGLDAHPLFRRRACQARPRLQTFRAQFLHWARAASNADDLEAEELLLALLRAALQRNGQQDAPVGTTTARMMRRAKEFLELELPNRVLLADVGRAAGASPAYLTDLFRRVEGIPLHRYLTRLRLSRALVELPHADDLTALALDVGFSSHSHFSAAFRRAFGCTPSEFRQATRREALAMPRMSPPPARRPASRPGSLEEAPAQDSH